MRQIGILLENIFSLGVSLQVYEFQLKHYFLNNTLNYIEFYTDIAICDIFGKKISTKSYVFMSTTLWISIPNTAENRARQL